ncbi:MAG: acyl-CoA dehydrogenase family protein [Acidimicrobiales bacterium]
MSHDVFTKIEESGNLIAEESLAGDELGRLTDDAAKKMKDIGVVRMLQPTDFGGYEADPRDFLTAVMDIGSHCPSAGWVAGVVGVHPWELAFNDRRLQEEVWGSDPDTWVASPYAPSGTATRVDGGYIVNGHWKFSSGTDHCDWVVLGASVPGEEGSPVAMLHVMLPRGDYEIVEDSWNVIGLDGTGSKDIVIRDQFVPAYRTLDLFKVMSGEASTEAGRHQPLYQLPWSTMFPCAVSAGLVGIAEGVLKHAIEYQQGRTSALGVSQASDSYSRTTIGEAAADIRGSRVQLVHDVGEMYDALCAGHEVTLQQRVACRRDQVRVAWRAAKAADDVFTVCGGNAIRLDKPLQRFWRGMHAGLQHGIFVAGPIYDDAAGMLMGFKPSGPSAMTI